MPGKPGRDPGALRTKPHRNFPCALHEITSESPAGPARNGVGIWEIPARNHVGIPPVLCTKSHRNPRPAPHEIKSESSRSLHETASEFPLFRRSGVPVRADGGIPGPDQDRAAEDKGFPRPRTAEEHRMPRRAGEQAEGAFLGCGVCEHQNRSSNCPDSCAAFRMQGVVNSCRARRIFRTVIASRLASSGDFRAVSRSFRCIPCREIP